MKAFFGILIALVLLFGCTGQAQAPVELPKEQSKVQLSDKPATGASVKEFKITISHTSYSAKTIEVNKGDTVRLLLNTGPKQSWHAHGITIDEYGLNAVVRSEDKSKPEILEFIADKAGTFKIYCKTCNEENPSYKSETGNDHPPIQATLIVD